jgi:ABC-type lipoprotein export system ATPase subunit
MNSDNIIEIDGLTRHYKMGDAEVRAIDGIDLFVAKGELVALVGSSGSGKTTLLNLIAGLDTPTGGQIFIDGSDLATKDSRQLALHRRHTVGMVFQSFNLIPSMTAFENVQLPLILSSAPLQERVPRTNDALESMGLKERRHHKPSQMSGGEQQRTAIARALVNRPKILLADEPTGNLDGRTSIEIMELLRSIHESGTTVILVTHNMPIAEQYCERIVQMNYGKIVA